MENLKQKKELFKKVDNFHEKESQFLDYLHVRWMDEAGYEDPQEYETSIVLKAHEYDLNVTSIKYNFRNLSMKITFTDSNKNNIYLELLQTKTKIYA